MAPSILRANLKKNPVQNRMLKKEPSSHYSSKFNCETRNDNLNAFLIK